MWKTISVALGSELVPSFIKLAHPLSQLLQEESDKVWTGEQSQI